MFTGIVESTGFVEEIIYSQSNLSIWIHVDFVHELKIDQSVAHNGICLTIDQIVSNRYRITAIEETIKKTTIGDWKKGDQVNIERCLQVGARLDGHFVQGHVDAVVCCVSKMDRGGSIEFVFEYPKEYSALVIEKGSIAIDGISLTCFELFENQFKVALIPYTLEHTIASKWVVGGRSNVEFDILGKYLTRHQSIQ
jgi:riboflavin synthase